MLKSFNFNDVALNDETISVQTATSGTVSDKRIAECTKLLWDASSFFNSNTKAFIYLKKCIMLFVRPPPPGVSK